MRLSGLRIPSQAAQLDTVHDRTHHTVNGYHREQAAPVPGSGSRVSGSFIGTGDGGLDVLCRN